MESGHLAVFKSFNSHRVKYVVVGGIAAVLYGSPRLTKDLDLFIEPTLRNATKALKALKALHFGTADLTTPRRLLQYEVTLFEDVIRLDLLSTLKGLTFSQVWKNRRIEQIEGIRVPLISLKDLIQSKKAAARPIDLEDLHILRRIVSRT